MRVEVVYEIRSAAQTGKGGRRHGSVETLASAVYSSLRTRQITLTKTACSPAKIGYLVPQFPSQTHIFFWRELMALKEGNVETDLISTSRPPPAIISHTWSREAASRTTYLREHFSRFLVAVLSELFRGGPSGWMNCFKAMRKNRDDSWARQFGLMLLGAMLAALARRRGWYHVHVHSCADSANIAMFATLLSGLHYSLTLHGPLRDYGGNQRQKWRQARFGIVITQRLLTEVRSALGDDAPERISVSPMGVDLSVFTRSAPYQAAASGGPLRIFSCGRLNPCKGHADLIEAVAILRSSGINACLEIAGEDEQGGSGYHVELSALIEARGLNNFVALPGAVSEAHVRRSLESCHVFALLSVAEPLGVAIMEAMAMEVPVIATLSGGVPELITDGRDGVLVPPQDACAAAEAIRRLASEGELSIRIGAAARRTIIDQFQSKRSAQAIIGALRA
jgi:colanic acid/amylovoran biosynthesis glycosyltransferase